MKDIKRIIARLCLLTAILLLVNLCYKNTFWIGDLDKHADMLWEQLHHEDTCDVLYFGESSDFHTDSTDINKKSISHLTSEYFPSLRFGAVSRPAVHAGIYSSVIKHLSPGSKVKTVVFTLNMRSFDAGWINSALESYIQKTNIMYQPYPPVVNRFLFSLNAFENKSEKQREEDMKAQWARDKLVFPYAFPYKNVIEWDQAMANGGYLKADGSWDQPKIDLACHYIKSYAFQIDTKTNPRIKDFDEIVKTCKNKDLNIVFNLLAENTQYADSLVGKDLIYLMKQNRDLLVEKYTNMGVTVVDNLELLNGIEYVDQHWTTEHYKESGRKKIAKNLAEHLKKFYPGDFNDHNFGFSGE
jgi:hypothetical protein